MNLIKMELYKIFKKKSIIFLLIISTLTIYLSNKKDNYIINNYEIISTLGMNKKELSITQEYNKKVKNQVKINEYYKENNIENSIKIKKILNSSLTIIVFTSVIIIILSTSTISEEINKKSIKELLTKPYKRRKIITSKILANFIIIFIITIYVAVIYLIITNIITSTNIFLLKDEIVKNNEIIEISYYLTYLKKIFINSIPLYFISVLSIFLSIIINNIKITSAILIFLTLMSTMIFQLLLSININLVEYTFIPYLDLTIYDDLYNIYILNITNGTNVKVNTGIIILIFYSLVFYVMSIVIFNKKDYL